MDRDLTKATNIGLVNLLLSVAERYALAANSLVVSADAASEGVRLRQIQAEVLRRLNLAHPELTDQQEKSESLQVIPAESRLRTNRNLNALFAQLPAGKFIPFSVQDVIDWIRDVKQRHPDFLPEIHFSPFSGLSVVLEDFLFTSGVWRGLNFSADSSRLLVSVGIRNIFDDRVKGGIFTAEELAIITEEGTKINQLIEEKRREG